MSFLTKATQKMKAPNILYVGKSDDVFLALNTYVFGTQYILAIINRTTRKMTLKVITQHIPIFSTPLGLPPLISNFPRNALFTERLSSHGKGACLVIFWAFLAKVANLYYIILTAFKKYWPDTVAKFISGTQETFI